MWSLQNNKQIRHRNGCELGNVTSWYQHGTNGTLQRVYGNYRTMQRVHAYNTVVRHQPYRIMRHVLECMHMIR